MELVLPCSRALSLSLIIIIIIVSFSLSSLTSFRGKVSYYSSLTPKIVADKTAKDAFGRDAADLVRRSMGFALCKMQVNIYRLCSTSIRRSYRSLEHLYILSLSLFLSLYLSLSLCSQV
jgi:hypothetical protein